MIFSVDIDVYNQSLIFLLEHYDEKSKEWFKTNFSEEDYEIINSAFEDPPEYNTFSGRFYTLENQATIIYCPEFDFSHLYFSILAHEIYHATSQILFSRGLSHTEETEEAFAYLNQYIHSVSLKTLFKQWNNEANDKDTEEISQTSESEAS